MLASFPSSPGKFLHDKVLRLPHDLRGFADRRFLKYLGLFQLTMDPFPLKNCCVGDLPIDPHAISLKIWKLSVTNESFTKVNHFHWARNATLKSINSHLHCNHMRQSEAIFKFTLLSILALLKSSNIKSLIFNLSFFILIYFANEKHFNIV